METAIIMVKTAAGKSGGLQTSIGALDGIREVHIVAGQYDLVVETTDESVYDLMHGPATRIRDLDGVMDTRTYICLG